MGGEGGTGDDKSEKSSQQAIKSSTSGDQQSSYATALLKKKEAESEKKKEEDTAPIVTTTDNNDVDSITRQTEEMEREILSEFHDLSLIGDEKNDSFPSSPWAAKNHKGMSADDKTEGQTVGTTGTASSSPSMPNNNSMPILPGRFPETYSSVESPTKQHQQPAIEVSTNGSVDYVSPPDIAAEPPTAKDQMSSSSEQSTPKVWGSKRFADVSLFYTRVFFDELL